MSNETMSNVKVSSQVLVKAHSLVGKVVDGVFTRVGSAERDYAERGRDTGIPVPYVLCQFMARLISANQVDHSLGSSYWSEFHGVRCHLLHLGLIGYAELSPPQFLPLRSSSDGMRRGLCLWYVFSRFTKVELNHMLGWECFVDEGGRPGGPWPLPDVMARIAVPPIPSSMIYTESL